MEAGVNGVFRKVLWYRVQISPIKQAERDPLPYLTASAFLCFTGRQAGLGWLHATVPLFNGQLGSRPQ